MAPSQVCGAIRIVPLLRPHPRPDLRLGLRRYGEELTVVGPNKTEVYMSYVPHGMILSWSDDGSPVAAFGTRLNDPKIQGRSSYLGPFTARFMPRMVKRDRDDRSGATNRLRFLPLHLAMEGFLDLHFGGPAIAWEEYARSTLAYGLSPRWETAVPGQDIRGLAEALRVFEIHETQAGVLVFVAEALASAFVVSNPEDYRAMHRSLLEDFYGDLLYQYGLLYSTTYPVHVELQDARIHNLDDLRREFGRVRSDWAAYHGVMAGNLLGCTVQGHINYTAGPFTLQHFLTGLDPSGENHIGEALVRYDGTLEYLKTYRLSAAQTRRAYLLSRLAEAEWNLTEAARALDTTHTELVLRLEKSGFGYLLKNNVLEVAHARRRRGLD